MLVSEHISNLQKLLEEKGDQELYTWADNGDDTVYIVKVPELKIEEITGDEFQIPIQIPKESRNQNGKVLIITNIETSYFDEEIGIIRDLEVEEK